MYRILILFLIFSATLTAQTTLPNEKNLVGIYSFEGNANDKSPSGNHGVVYGEPQLVPDRFGKPNAAYKFDGVDDFIEIVPKNNLSELKDFTISIWLTFHGFKRNAWIHPHADRQYIFCGHTHSKTTRNDFTRDGVSIMFDLEHNREKKFVGLIKNKNGQKNNYTRSATPPLNKWVHLVISRKGNVLYQYLDGKLVNQGSASNSVLNMQHNLYIGTAMGNNPYYNGGKFNYSFKGIIDDINVYDKGFEEHELPGYQKVATQKKRKIVPPKQETTIIYEPAPQIDEVVALQEERIVPPAQDMVIQPKEFKETKLELKEQIIEVRTRDIKLKLWDNAQEDGDVVSIFLNDDQQYLVKEVTVKRVVQTFDIRLDKKDNLLIFFAENEGTTPPNTAALLIDDGITRQKIILSADKKTSEALRIKIKK